MKISNSLKLTFIYLLAGLIWIYFSDAIVALFFRTVAQQLFYQTIKGFFYVVSTAVMLYFLLRNFYEAQLEKLTEIRKKNNEIKETENRYQLLFAKSPLAVLTVDADTGMLLDWNDKAVSFFELTGCEKEVNSIRQVLPEYFFVEGTNMPKRMDGPCIVLHKRSDGSAMNIEISGSTFSYNGVACLQLLCNDVSDRERAIRRLADNERKLLSAQKIAKIGYWQYMMESGKMYWSDEVYEIWGTKADEFDLRYESFYNSIHPDDRHLLPSSITDSKSDNVDFDIEHRIVLGDGRIKWVHERGTLQCDEQGQPKYLEGTVQDITSQKLLSISLEESVQRYDYVTKATSDAIWDWDLIEQRMLWNESGNSPIKLPLHKDEDSEIQWLNHIEATDRERVRASISKAIEDGLQYWSEEYRCMCKQHQYMYVRNVAYILRDNTGKAVRIIGAISDITEQKKKELNAQVLSAISIAFSVGDSLAKALELLMKTVCEMGNVDLAETWIVGAEQKRINLIAKYATPDIATKFYSDQLMPISFEPGVGMPGKCWVDGVLLKWEHVDENEYFIRSRYAMEAGLRTVYGMPLKYNNEVLGVILLGMKYDDLDTDIFTSLLDSAQTQLTSEIKRRQAEEEMNQLFAFAPDMVCVAGLDGYYKRINPAMIQILGYSEEELLSSPVTHFVHPEDVDKTLAELDVLKSGAPTVYFENRYITKSKVTKWIAWTATPPSIEGLVFSVGKDITEKKELELLLNTATRLANIGAWEIDVINEKISWSDITRQIHGIIDDSYHPSFEEATLFYKEGEYRDRIIMAVTDAIQYGKKWDEESQIVTVDGRTKWIRSIGVPEFYDGICVRVIGSFQDIDHLKRAEIAALETLREKETILERIGDAFFAVDAQWTVMYWNNKAEQILGKNRADIIGRNLWVEYADTIGTPFEINYKNAVSTGESQHFEAWYEGTKSWYEVAAFPSATGLSIFFKDVTERKRYIQEIEHNNEALRAIAWSQSHEVRAPLVRILGLVNLLHETPIDGEQELKSVLNMIVESANELDSVVKRINEKTKK